MLALAPMKIRAGIIGFGLSGRYFHAPFLKAHEGFEVVAVSSSSAEKVKAYLRQTKVYASPAELIADPNIDLVINCGPNRAHFPLSRDALLAGKHVVVEKPFVNSAAEANELIQLARAQKRILSVFQNRRWDSDFLTLKKLVAEGRLGEVMHFASHFDVFKPKANPGRWREKEGAGSGTWVDLGAHLVDQMLVLFGVPDFVQADMVPQREGSTVDDYFHAVFGYGKRRVVLQSSLFAATLPRFTAYGTKASFVKFGLDPQEARLRAGKDPTEDHFGEEPAAQFGRLIQAESKEEAIVASERGSYWEFYHLLYSSIVEKRAEGPIPLQDSLKVVQILELARKSAEEGQRLSVNL